ncbi:D-Ala-D-Ala carboxypeptidase family metallohydrolase [Leptothoe spongobia]|uniref:Peptidase M15 n=1 Tax=Leptothoe spongobia TAU-MAC 1115 TaxID=1967444 RepID=A0A947DFE7_9CYAN|nr:D-Ala-D-Ala carboxypeptidase family metallohydrolase [Leptothoe spongobia]MBT9315886.1 peptidase M15 [Leptothoe spongobia TAU-MAC 1115]
MDLTLEKLEAVYKAAFDNCALQPEIEPTVRGIVGRMVQLRSHYESVEKVIGVPWWFVGILHYSEWNFREPEQFERQVTDILIAKRYHQAKTRTMGAFLWGFDLWNGFQSGAGKESTWVWGGTNVLKQKTSRIGAAAIVRYLQLQELIDMGSAKTSTELLVLTDTLFKLRPDQSFKLSEADKIRVSAGTRLELLRDDPDKANHVKVRIPDGVLMGQDDRVDWYVFAQHIQLEGTEPNNKPKDPPAEPETKIAEKDRGRPITVPKLGQVYLGEPILENGHFSWAEATKNGSRIPVDENVVNGILQIAEAMEEVREYLGGRPISVNSWYRDPASNRKAGGASRSRHLSGDAVDFVVQGISPPEVNRRLEPWWGDRGGIASASVFTHIDARGYRARWDYGF